MTDSLNDLTKKLRTVSDMINMGEKISWGQETALMDEAADAIEKLIGDASNCKQSDGIMHFLHIASSEISEHDGDANYWKTRYLLLKEKTKTPEPVSSNPVSLKECARAVHAQIPGAGKFESFYASEWCEYPAFGKEFLEGIAKSVLDAAGLKYVD